MRTRPDKVSADVIYQWILNCIDYYSKFNWAFALKNKSVNEVAVKLRELFFTFGSSQILHCDNGREFISSVMLELKNLFPELVFHPRKTETSTKPRMYRKSKWMSTNDSSSWSSALLPVVYGINTRMFTVTKRTPCEVMFDQTCHSNFAFWKMLCENGIEDGEQLSTPVDHLGDDLI
jgi:hypothetical protein